MCEFAATHAQPNVVVAFLIVCAKFPFHSLPQDVGRNVYRPRRYEIKIRGLA